MEAAEEAADVVLVVAVVEDKCDTEIGITLHSTLLIPKTVEPLRLLTKPRQTMEETLDRVTIKESQTLAALLIAAAKIEEVAESRNGSSQRLLPSPRRPPQGALSLMNSG